MDSAQSVESKAAYNKMLPFTLAGELFYVGMCKIVGYNQYIGYVQGCRQGVFLKGPVQKHRQHGIVIRNFAN